MNERYSEAKPGDRQLLNYETVKYFGNEPTRRDDSIGVQAYERAAVKSSDQLSWLNVGQGGVIAIG